MSVDPDEDRHAVDDVEGSTAGTVTSWVREHVALSGGRLPDPLASGDRDRSAPRGRSARKWKRPAHIMRFSSDQLPSVVRLTASDSDASKLQPADLPEAYRRPYPSREHEKSKPDRQGLMDNNTEGSKDESQQAHEDQPSTHRPIVKLGAGDLARRHAPGD